MAKTRIGRDIDVVRGYFVEVVPLQRHSDVYRAELWWNPYDGRLLAMTRWTTKRTAQRDGKRYLRIPSTRRKQGAR